MNTAYRYRDVGSQMSGLELMAHQAVDCTSAFGRLGKRVRTKEIISIALGDHTYLPDGELVQGWFPNILRAFGIFAARISRENVSVRSFGSIGVGPGLDAIAAVELLNVESLVLTDLHEDVVELARDNVLVNCPAISASRVQAFTSDLCSGLIERQLTVDVLYENLPNLPLAEVEITKGALAASFFERSRMRLLPELYSRHRLGLHYLFLQQAHRCLSVGGSVVCCIGGRVSMSVVRSMFDECRYMPAPLYFDMVRQFESAKVLAGYVDAEAEGDIRFRFYPYDEGRRVLTELRDEGLAVDDVFADPRLKSITLMASEAQAMESSGTAIGHVGVVWRGVPKTT